MYQFDPKARRFFGRRRTRGLRPGQQDAFDAVMAKNGISPDVVTQQGAVYPLTLFPRQPEQIWFEIGFGDGTFMHHMLEAFPNRAYIAAEPYENGVGSLCKKIAHLQDPLVRIWMEDGIPLLKTMQDNSFDGIYVLNPDPWPKLRHHKRRLINEDSLTLFASKLKDGGQLIMTSDVDDLSAWMLTHAKAHPEFEWTAKGPDDWLNPPPDWRTTKYERKGLEAARTMTYLVFKRKKRLAKPALHA
jgi:tRNA (guanine-N7-)-methyltransferase